MKQCLIRITCAFATAFIAFIGVVQAAGSTTDGEVIYAKNLADGSRLAVLKTEIPKERVEIPKLPADLVPLPIEGAFEYTFQIRLKDGTFRNVHGKKQMVLLKGEVERMKFAVLDANEVDGHVVVLYKVGGLTFADLTTRNAAGEDEFVMGNDSLIIIDARGSGSFVAGGWMEGSIKEGSLRMFIAACVSGQPRDRRFLLSEKNGAYRWVKDPPAAGQLPDRLLN